MDHTDTSQDHGEDGQRGSLSRRGFLGAAGSAAALTTVIGTGTASASTLPPPASKHASPQLRVPGAGLVGATVVPQGSNTRGQQAQLFDGYAGRPLAETVQKIYYKQHEFPTSDKEVGELAALGCQVILCYKPMPGGGDGTALTDSIKALKKAYQNVLAVVLWQEVQNQSNGIAASDYIAMIRQDYGPAVRALTNLYYDASPNGTNGDMDIKTYFPGGGYIDATTMDLYADQYYNGHTLDTIQSLADSSPSTPLGILEFGITANGTGIPSDVQILAFFDYLLSTMSARLASGKANGPVLYYDGGGPDDITTTADYRVSTLDAMFDTLCQNSSVQG